MSKHQSEEKVLGYWEKVLSYLFLWFVDHGILRAPHENLHALEGPLYRANQPSPAKIRKYKRKYGIQTIVNLRGNNPSAAWQKLEQETCKRENIELRFARVQSREAPSKEIILELKSIIESMQLPALAHCKSGADRGGLFAVLYRHFRLGHPIEEAVEELHWKYGHFKAAKTGVIDHFFQDYLRNRRQNQTFIDWVTKDYDRAVTAENFKPERWSRFFVDVILGRE